MKRKTDEETKKDLVQKIFSGKRVVVYNDTFETLEVSRTDHLVNVTSVGGSISFKGMKVGGNAKMDHITELADQEVLTSKQNTTFVLTTNFTYLHVICNDMIVFSNRLVYADHDIFIQDRHIEASKEVTKTGSNAPPVTEEELRQQPNVPVAPAPMHCWFADKFTVTNLSKHPIKVSKTQDEIRVTKVDAHLDIKDFGVGAAVDMERVSSPHDTRPLSRGSSTEFALAGVSSRIYLHVTAYGLGVFVNKVVEAGSEVVIRDHHVLGAIFVAQQKKSALEKKAASATSTDEAQELSHLKTVIGAPDVADAIATLDANEEGEKAESDATVSTTAAAPPPVGKTTTTSSTAVSPPAPTSGRNITLSNKSDKDVFVYATDDVIPEPVTDVRTYEDDWEQVTMNIGSTHFIPKENVNGMYVHVFCDDKVVFVNKQMNCGDNLEIQQSHFA